MKVEEVSKDKIIKLIGLFIVLMLIFTMISKTIYMNLLPVVAVDRPKSGSVETRLMLDCKVGLNEKILAKKTKQIRATMQGKIGNYKLEENMEVHQGDLICILYSEDAVDDESINKEALEIEKLQINEDTVNRQISSLKQEIASEEKKYEAMKAKYNEIEKRFEIVSKDKEITEQAKALQINKELFEEGLIAESEYLETKNKLEMLTLERKSLINEEQNNLEESLNQVLEAIASKKDALIQLQNSLKTTAIEIEAIALEGHTVAVEGEIPVNAEIVTWGIRITMTREE